MSVQRLLKRAIALRNAGRSPNRRKPPFSLKERLRCLLQSKALCKEKGSFFTKERRLSPSLYRVASMPTAWQPSTLPPTPELETRAVLKNLPAARRALAELKGLVAAIPNESILLDTLPL